MQKGDAMDAVSYTHLDVYKRQVYNNLTCEKRHEFFEGFGHEEIQDFDDLIIPFFCKGGETHV